MSWAALVPVIPVKSTGRPMVSARLTLTQKGLTVSLFLSSFVVDKWSHPRVDVEVGSGEHTGMLRVVPCEAGVYAVGKGPRGSARITLPAWEGLPSGTTSAEACGSIEDSAEVLVVRLPVAEWEIAVSRASKATTGGGQTGKRRGSRYPGPPHHHGFAAVPLPDQRGGARKERRFCKSRHDRVSPAQGVQVFAIGRREVDVRGRFCRRPGAARQGQCHPARQPAAAAEARSGVLIWA